MDQSAQAIPERSLHQTISFSVPGTDRVLARLQKGPIPMSKTVADISPDIVELREKGFAVHQNGFLWLLRDAPNQNQ